MSHTPTPTPSSSKKAPPYEPIEVIARALIWRDGRLLLCKNRKHGHTYLPGGHVEAGEPATEACRRELLEETGLAVRVGGLLAIAEARFEQRGRLRHEYSMVFHVEHPPSPPETVPSLEEKISFEWATPRELSERRFEPEELRAWASGLSPDSIPHLLTRGPVWLPSD